MITEIKQYLSRSQKGRAIVAEIESGVDAEIVSERRKLANERKRILQRQEKEAPQLRKQEEDARAAVQRAKEALAAAREEHGRAVASLTQLGNEVEQVTRRCEAELREGADRAIDEFLVELSQGLDAARGRGAGYLGIRMLDVTLEGGTELVRAVMAAHEGARALQLEPEVPDVDAAIGALRQALVERWHAIFAQYARDRVKTRQEKEERKRIGLLVLEKELADRRRRGWPADALAEFEREERAALE